MRFLKAGTASSGRIAARILGLVLLVLVLAAQSRATDIIVTMEGSISDYLSYTYTDADGTTHTEYTGPYPVIVSGGSYGAGVQVYVMCYDINLDAYVGASYNGEFVLPDEADEIEAAYLQNQLVEDGGFSADVQTVSGPISMAIWQLMDGSSQNPAPFAQDPAAAALVAEAQNAYLSGAWTQADAERYPLWAPTPLGSTQRFGFLEGQAPLNSDIVPEPASPVLMAAGFAVVLALRRKR